MNDISARVGERIRKIRQRQGISLEELSFQSAVNAAHLGQIERGQQNPTVETLDKIMAALGVPLAALFDDIEAPSTQPGSSQNAIRNKINAHLSAMSAEEQKDVLQIIRIYRRQPESGDPE